MSDLGHDNTGCWDPERPSYLPWSEGLFTCGICWVAEWHTIEVLPADTEQCLSSYISYNSVCLHRCMAAAGTDGYAAPRGVITTQELWTLANDVFTVRHEDTGHSTYKEMYTTRANQPKQILMASAETLTNSATFLCL